MVPARVDDVLFSERFLDAGGHSRGIAAVFREQIDRLDRQRRGELIRCVKTGPDRERLMDRLRDWISREPTAEEVEQEVAGWQRRRLHWFRGNVPDELRALAVKLKVSIGEIDFDDQELAEVGFSSSAATVTWDDDVPSLGTASDHDISEILQGGGDDPGDARVNSGLTAFGRDWVSRVPTILSKNEGAEWKWTRVAALAAGVRERSVSGDHDENAVAACVRILLAVLPAETSGVGASRPLLDAHRTVLDLLRDTLREHEKGGSARSESAGFVIEIANRHGLWSVPLGESVGEDLAPEVLALNHPAGSLVRVALAAAGAPREGTAHPSSEPPDALPVLDALSDALGAASGDGAVAFASALGELLPWFLALHTSWYSANEAAIYRVEDAHGVPVAWCRYLLRHRSPRRDAWPLTRERYRSFLSRSEVGEPGASGGNLGAACVRHILFAVIQGWESLDDPDGILRAALRHLPRAAWEKGLASLFRRHSVQGAEPVPDVIAARTLGLWEWCLGWEPTEAKCDITTALGVLIRVRGLEGDRVPTLMLETLIRSGGRTPTRPDWSHLRTLVPHDPRSVAESVFLLVVAELQSEYPFIRSRDLLPLLEDLSQAGDPTVSSVVERTVRRLGGAGHLEFRELA